MEIGDKIVRVRDGKIFRAARPVGEEGSSTWELISLDNEDHATVSEAELSSGETFRFAPDANEDQAP